MKYSDYKFSLDIHSVDTPVSLAVKKGDTNRRICITLRENGSIYPISEGCSASLKVNTPDGVVKASCTFDDNVILCPLSADMTSKTGKFESDIALTEGTQKLTTPKFYIIVDDTLEEVSSE